jgi:hypothetical protein
MGEAVRGGADGEVVAAGAQPTGVKGRTRAIAAGGQKVRLQKAGTNHLAAPAVEAHPEVFAVETRVEHELVRIRADATGRKVVERVLLRGGGRERRVGLGEPSGEPRVLGAQLLERGTGVRRGETSGRGRAAHLGRPRARGGGSRDTGCGRPGIGQSALRAGAGAARASRRLDLLSTAGFVVGFVAPDALVAPLLSRLVHQSARARRLRRASTTGPRICPGVGRGVGRGFSRARRRSASCWTRHAEMSEGVKEERDAKGSESDESHVRPSGAAESDEKRRPNSPRGGARGASHVQPSPGRLTSPSFSRVESRPARIVPSAQF